MELIDQIMSQISDYVTDPIPRSAGFMYRLVRREEWNRNQER